MFTMPKEKLFKLAILDAGASNYPPLRLVLKYVSKEPLKVIVTSVVSTSPANALNDVRANVDSAQIFKTFEVTIFITLELY